MGSVHYIAKSNEFWIKNLIDFKAGLKGFVGGEWESEPVFHYNDYKRRSKRALIELNNSDFSDTYYKKDDSEETLNFLEYIKTHIEEGEVCTIHFVAYEHPGDMVITRYNITSESVEEIIILGDE